jgi:bifunctional ADP-heptose synthase (sugar kinase/adenylyltransferase)
VTSGPLVVVGDALLDIDLVGRAGRLAPDAPVPVLDGLHERRAPAAPRSPRGWRRGTDATSCS